MADVIIKRGILEVDADYRKLSEGLAVVNERFGKTHDAAKDVSAEIAKLATQEVKLLEGRAKANNPSVMVKFTAEIKKVRTEMEKLQQSEKDVVKETNELAKSGQKLEAGLRKAFNVATIDAARNSTRQLAKEIDNVFAPDQNRNPIENIDEGAKKGRTEIQKLKDEYKAMVNEAIKLKRAGDEIGYQKAIVEAGKLKEELKDLNEGVNAIDQGFGNVEGAIATVGGIAGGFEAAAGAAALFGGETEEIERAMQKVRATQAILNGLREVSTLLEKKEAANVFLSNVAYYAKAAAMSVATGAAVAFNAVLNANPIFLLITAIVAITVGLAYLGGLLGSIGQAFVWLGEAAYTALNIMTFGLLGFLTSGDSLLDQLKKQLDATKKQMEAEKKRRQEIEKTAASLLRQADAEAKLRRAKAEAFELEKRLLEAQNKDTKKRQLETLKNAESSIKSEIKLRLDAASRLKEIADKNLKDADVVGITNKLLGLTDADKLQTAEGVLEFEKNIKKLKELSQVGGGTQFFQDRKLKDALSGTAEDFEELRKTIEDEKEAELEIFTSLADKAKEKADKIKDIISDLRDELESIQDENAGQRIESLLFDDDKINASIDLKKKIFNRELDQRREALKAEGTLTKEADELLAQIRIENNNNFEAERTQQLVAASKERQTQLIESENELSQMEIELGELGLTVEKTNFDARIALAQDYYAKRIELAHTLGESEDDIRKIELQRDIDIKKLQKSQLDELIATNAAKFDEKTRHELAMAQLAKASESEQLQIQIEAESLKLATLIMSGQAQTLEAEKTNNTIKELEAKQKEVQEKERQERIVRILEDIKKIVDASLAAANQIIQAEINKADKLIQLQQKRVDDVARIAESGNAELLELEQKRLDDLNKEKERFVRQQQALAVVELVANSAIAIAKAAAEGGAAAPITIAATLIALIAGLAAARQAASTAAFYEGGYTGDGNPRDVSTALGNKPYEYHKAEWVFNHEKTDQFYDVFKRVHMGEIDLNEWESKVNAFDALNFDNMQLLQPVAMPIHDNSADMNELKGLMSELIYAYKATPQAKIVLDKAGFSAHLKSYQDQQSSIDHMAH